jgi:Reverse transcriptase (RNA-dependent DNA polymerase)
MVLAGIEEYPDGPARVRRARTRNRPGASARWLKVGIIEDGRVTRSQVGAPQGAVISPILANVYLHYAYELWVHRWRRTQANGDVIVVRYADDRLGSSSAPCGPQRRPKLSPTDARRARGYGSANATTASPSVVPCPA